MNQELKKFSDMLDTAFLIFINIILFTMAFIAIAMVMSCSKSFEPTHDLCDQNPAAHEECAGLSQ